MAREPSQENTTSGGAIELTLEALASKISASSPDQRTIIAIAGPPGSGKSTTANNLQLLLKETCSLSNQIVPMDGFHYDNAILEALGLTKVKGSPPTFDVTGFADTLRRLSISYQQADVAIPVFDRDNDLSRGSARLVKKETQLLLVEGNYLLMDLVGWKDLAAFFDVTVMIACDEDELRTRLMRRWLDLDYSVTAAADKVEENDLPNARAVLEGSRQSDFLLISD